MSAPETKRRKKVRQAGVQRRAAQLRLRSVHSFGHAAQSCASTSIKTAPIYTTLSSILPTQGVSCSCLSTPLSNTVRVPPFVGGLLLDDARLDASCTPLGIIQPVGVGNCRRSVSAHVCTYSISYLSHGPRQPRSYFAGVWLVSIQCNPNTRTHRRRTAGRKVYQRKGQAACCLCCGTRSGSPNISATHKRILIIETHTRTILLGKGV